MSSLFVLFCIQCYTSLAPPQHQGQGSADVAELDCRRRHFNTLSMGKIGKACLQNLAELLFARINLVMLDWSTKKPLPYHCADWKRFQYFSMHFAWFALPLSGLGTGMLSLPWAMAGASILVGAVIIVLLVGVVAPCGTSNVHDCIGAYWCILVHIGAYWCLASLQRGFVLQIPKAFACFADF